MVRKVLLGSLAVLLVAAMIVPHGVAAQDNTTPYAWTETQTNLRTGPGTGYPIITTLPIGVQLVIEARNADTSWILLRAENGLRGWGRTRLFRLSGNFQLRALPVSTEIIDRSAVAGAAPPDNVRPPEVSGTAPLDAPFIPKITPSVRAAMRAIVAKGRQMGNNPRVFSKVGDCMTDHPQFLNPFAWGQYNLREYAYLQATIDYFNVKPREDVGSSWDAGSLAAHNGFNSSAVREPQWANPALCQPNESPLKCEYRLNKPAVAVIMFGIADVLVMTPQQFYRFMLNIVNDSLAAGVVPLLSTFPENPSVPQLSRQVNQMVLALARQKNVPVMNFADAVKNLPNGGLEADGIHLSLPPGLATDFSPENLQYGMTVRNLLVLQSLDLIRREILN
ncbi:MAG: SH3 domain-containing protein [Anaerolineae bacterium]|nr:SH3 domain-containing protein [Anaerolineae bacterium]